MNLNALNTFLNKNPKLLSKYINVSMTVIGVVLKPINTVMKHALVVQGIDPKTYPGEKQRKELQTALDKNLTKLHEQDFDDDYDFSWAKKCLGITNDKLVELQLTKDTYNKLTDLTHVDDKPIVLDVTNPAARRETRLYPTAEEKTVKETEASRPTKFVVHPDSKPMPFLDTPSFKDAVAKLKEYAAILSKDSIGQLVDEVIIDDVDDEEDALTQKEIDDAGKNFFEMQRAKRKAAYEAEELAAVKHNLKKKLGIKPIETYRKGLFNRVDKKRE